VRVREWFRDLRDDPKRLFERDLIFAAVGLSVVIIGGAITAGGISGRGPYPSAPEPALGKAIVWVGLAIVLVGLGLAGANLVMYLAAKKRNRGRSPR
jgi:hypothetical protein